MPPAVDCLRPTIGPDSSVRHRRVAPPRLELVVARYAEDLAWLKRVPREFAVTVYDKGDGSSGGMHLPNVGREAHTYMHHLATNYGELAELTVFVQGHPFDHAPDLHTRLRAYANGAEVASDFWWLGFLADTDDSRGRRLFVPWSKNPERHELEMDRFHEELLGVPGPASYRFFVGGQFTIRRDTVLRRPQKFYAQAAEFAARFPLAPHCFERCWDRIFCCDGTHERLPADQATVYLKPVKRLATATLPDQSEGPTALRRGLEPQPIPPTQ